MMKPVKKNKEIIDQDLMNEIVEKFGEKPQLLMACEESNELSFAILKFIRHRDFNTNKEPNLDIMAIAEEIADMYIMLSQIKQMLKIEQDVEEKIVSKIARLIGRLKEHDKNTKSSK